MRRLLLLFVGLVPLMGSGQRFSLRPLAVPLLQNGAAGTLVGAGGFNAAQFSGGDIDRDGQYDMLIFDREANTATVLTLSSGVYSHNPELEARLPRMKDWALLRDYNGDGRPDLFCGQDDYVWLYRNEIGPDGGVNFNLMSSQLMSTSFSGGPLPVNVSREDMADVVDIDGDGDFDIIGFAYAGTTVNLNRNTSIETLGNREGFAFVKSGCWGRFAASSTTCNQYQLGLMCRLGDEPPPPLQQRPAHMGSTLQVRDADGDGDPDLLVGDIGCNELFCLINEPQQGVPVIGRIQADFPQGTKRASFPLFLAGYSLDFDNDGTSDLVAAPNVTQSEVTPAVNFMASAWRYRGRSPGSLLFIDSADWQKQMHDLGMHAAPAQFDLNGDGRLDIVSGTDNYYDAGVSYSRTHYYRSTNNGFEYTTLPPFLNTVRSEGNLPIIPIPADFNNDRRPDLGLLQTDANGDERLIYYQGLTTPAGGWAIAQTADTLSLSLRSGDVPAFADLDDDGDLDMILGRNRGQLQLYRNNGGSYVLTSANYLGLTADVTRLSVHPCIADFDGSGTPDLLISDARGYLRYYANPIYADGYTAAADTTLWMLENRYTAAHQGSFTYPAAAFLDADSLPDLIVGMGGGGLRFAQNTLRVPLAANSKIKRADLFRLYGSENIVFKQACNYQLINIQGQVMSQGEGLTGQIWSLPSNTPGAYWLRAQTSKGQIQIVRFVR